MTSAGSIPARWMIFSSVLPIPTFWQKSEPYTEAEDLCKKQSTLSYPRYFRIYWVWGDMMKKEKEQDCIRLDPEQRLCPEFDSTSIKLFDSPDREEMGVRVLDNFPEEHIQ